MNYTLSVRNAQIAADQFSLEIWLEASALNLRTVQVGLLMNKSFLNGLTSRSNTTPPPPGAITVDWCSCSDNGLPGVGWRSFYLNANATPDKASFNIAVNTGMLPGTNIVSLKKLGTLTLKNPLGWSGEPALQWNLVQGVGAAFANKSCITLWDGTKSVNVPIENGAYLIF